MNMVHNSLCRLCNESEETIPHAFAHWPKTHTLGGKVKQWFENNTNVAFNVNVRTIILGHENNIGLNIICLIVKPYISKSVL